MSCEPMFEVMMMIVLRKSTVRPLLSVMKQQLKPEFLNRIDEIVMFEPLTRKDIEKIVDIQLGIVRRMLAACPLRRRSRSGASGRPRPPESASKGR